MLIKKPPMGVNTWNTFGEEINEKMIFELADTMVDSGLRDLGYDYLVIDDCWSNKKRDKDGKLVPDKTKFPNGMKYVADYVHSKGLKFGMYSCVGTMTCAGYPGSYKHEYIDAKTFAEWGVDFLKYDYCYRSKATAGADMYRKMSTALKATGRDILFSACSWGHDDTEKWIDTTGANMWRATTDIKDSWAKIKELVNTADSIDHRNYMNCFMDLDMLIVGMRGNGFCAQGGCDDTEYITHFSYWSLFSSPLMIGCDIRKMDAETVRILTNKDVIAINQDSEMNRPYLMRCSDDMEDSPETPAYARQLENGDIALGFFNFSDNTVQNRFVTLDMLGLDADIDIECVAKDVWSGELLYPVNETFNVGNIEPHGCRLYRVSIKEK